MSKHVWKENAIGEGQYEGKMTCLQGYKCTRCKKVIFLPLGTNANDYVADRCTDDNVYRSEPGGAK